MDLLAAVRSDIEQEFSWWQKDVRATLGADTQPALSGVLDVDVAIVGGGFTGLWTALILKEYRPDLRVAILEAYRCGDGASSRNGGNVHGYWGALPTLLPLFGPDKSIEAARLGTLAQTRLRNFATATGRDVWWVEEGYLRVATSPAQVAKIRDFLNVARQLGVEHTLRHLPRAELEGFCNSPRFLEGLLFSEGATVHPARLAHALRQAVLDAGIAIFENTPVRHIRKGDPNRLETAHGALTARDVVLATYTGTMGLAPVARSTTLFSSFPVMSGADPDYLDRIGYDVAHGFADLRMFTHYFRRTRDGRILMGSGSGPLERGSAHNCEKLRCDRASVERAATGLRRFFPGMQGGVVSSWGYPIEVTADRLPYFGTLAGSRIHYGSGYSGHGVNAAVIAGECLSSLILDQKDQWTSSPFCLRKRLRFPIEPFRFIGGTMVRNAIVRCEDAEDAGLHQPIVAQAISKLPRIMGMRVGTR
ncbi:NAD(P)/FAD-dependent oxidoreductase [Aquamicrobium segne]|uniref:NAD(P)/FAD-dependent oxidoreductase n=1 Tax=Aquamicrobium segne TaxID=469547 RepID=A0ABW0GX01_9HYPH